MLQISPSQLIQVCKTVILNGPVGGLRKLAIFIIPGPDSNILKGGDELNDILGVTAPNQQTYSDISTKLSHLISTYDSHDILDDEVTYIFNLFKKSYVK